MTKLTLENNYGTFSVRVRKEDMSLPEMVDFHVIPLLLAAGYQRTSIDEYIKKTNTRKR